MTNTTESKTQPSHDEIAAYAYHLWEANGRRQGRDVEYWLQARTQLANRAAKASAAPTPESNGVATASKPENPKKRKQETPATNNRPQPAFASA